MKRLLLLSIICITALSQINAQKLQTKWIQQFESNMKIIDIPLAEENYVYIQLEKNNKKTVLQKRQISDNALIKEIDLEFLDPTGNPMKYTSILERAPHIALHTINSNIYVVSFYDSPKEKKSKIIIYKLNKETVTFDQYKIIVDSPFLKKNKLDLTSRLVHIDKQELVLIESVRISSKYETSDKHFFVLSKDGVEEITDKQLKALFINDNYTKVILNVNAGKANEKYAEKMKNENESYFICGILGNFMDTDYNEYAFIRNLKPKEKGTYEIYGINYNNQIMDFVWKTHLLTQTKMNDVRTNITGKKLYQEFNFTCDGNDVLSMFKQDKNTFLLKVKKNVTKGHSTLSQNGTDPIFVSYSDIEITKIDENRNYSWHKDIDLESHYTSGDEVFYEMKFGDKLILLFAEKYLAIDLNTGEYNIKPNDDFTLSKGFQIKKQPHYMSSYVYSSSGKKNKKVGIIQFID